MTAQGRRGNHAQLKRLSFHGVIVEATEEGTPNEICPVMATRHSNPGPNPDLAFLSLTGLLLAHAPAKDVANVQQWGIERLPRIGLRRVRAKRHQSERGDIDMLGTILLILLILALIGAIPAWPYSRSWGYGPSGVTVLLLIVLVVALSTGYI